MISDQDFLDCFHGEEVAVAGASAGGYITQANERFCQLTGYSKDELQYLTYQDISPEAWLVYENQNVIKHVFNEGHCHYQKEYITKSGEVVPIELEVFLLKNDLGEADGMWGKVWRIDQLDEVHQKIKMEAEK